MGLLEHFVSQLYRIATKAEIFFFFFIKNEEEYINRRKDTGERKDTKEREESKGRMRGPSYTN